MSTSVKEFQPDPAGRRDPFYSPNLSCRDSEFRIKGDPDEDRFFYYREYR